MASKKKTAAALGILALIAAAFGFASIAKADEDDDNGKWKGPDPGKPGGPRPKKPKGGGTRPTHVDPHDLWISPECDDLIVGDRWMADTVAPAIQEWLEMGYGAPISEFDGDLKAAVKYSAAAVTRGIVGPYSPLCVDSYPWADMYEFKNPKPQWEPPDGGADFQAWNEDLIARQDQWRADYPALIGLLNQVEQATLAAWSNENA